MPVIGRIITTMIMAGAGCLVSSSSPGAVEQVAALLIAGRRVSGDRVHAVVDRTIALTRGNS